MFDFELCIDTSDNKYMCCRQPIYGFHEAMIMIEYISQLETSSLIYNCEESWINLLLLVVKLY